MFGGKGSRKAATGKGNSSSSSSSESSKPSSATPPANKQRRKAKIVAVTNQTRNITNKPFVASGGGIPRSFLQQNVPPGPTPVTPSTIPLQSHPKKTRSTASKKSGLLESHLDFPGGQKSKTKGEMTMDGISLDQYRDAKDFASLFTSDNLEKYPFLGLVYDQVKKGDIAGATQTLYTVTRTIQQDLGEDPALQSIFDPTKHKDFASALGELIFNDTDKNILPKPVSHRLKIASGFRLTKNESGQDDEEDQQQQGSGLPDGDYSRLTRGFTPRNLRPIDPSVVQSPNPLMTLNTVNKPKPKSVLPDPQPALNSLNTSTSPIPTKKVYKSSPAVTKQLSPNQWKQLQHTHSNDFEQFDNPTFMISKKDANQNPNRRSRFAEEAQRQRELDAEPLLATLLEHNPWYLPSGELNVAYIRANAKNFDESHARFLKDSDINTVIDLLEDAIDENKTPYEEHQDEMAKIQQRSIEMGLLNDFKPTLASTTIQADPAAQRAQAVFGSHHGENIPSTAELASQVPRHVAKFQADRNRIDSQLGGPLLDELTMVTKLTSKEREQMGIDPLRGSLSLLTPVDVERIKKEYNFSDPNDVMKYILRFLGRTAAEVDHQYNLPRHKYEELQIEYEKLREQDIDLKALKEYADIEFKMRLKYDGKNVNPDQMKAHHALQTQKHMSESEDGEDPSRTLHRELVGASRAHEGLKASSHDILSSQQITRPDGTVLKVGPDGKPIVLTAAEAASQKPGGGGDQAQNYQDGSPESNSQAAAELMGFFGERVGGNAEDTRYMDDWLANAPTKGQGAVGLAGIFGDAVAQIKSRTAGADNQLREMEMEADPHGRTKEEIAMGKKEREKFTHRQEYENSLDNLHRSKLRAIQIGIKIGKHNDPEWLEAKQKQIYKLFEIYHDSPDSKGMELLRLNPEQRAQRIVKKTREKMESLYKKYLPEPTFEEKQQQLQDQIDALKVRGNKAALEAKIQQESTRAILESNLENMTQAKYALKQRQDALVRRQREIAMHQRAMEWSAEGHTPEQVIRLEEQYAAEMAAKGVDVSPITAEMSIGAQNSTHNQIRRLLDEANALEQPLSMDLAPKTNIKTTTTPLLAHLHDKQIQISTNAAILATPSTPSGVGVNSGFINQFGQNTQDIVPPGLVSGQGTANTETKSLLGSVQRRRLLRDLKTKTETNSTPQLTAEGVLHIPPEEFQKRVELVETKKREVENQRREQKRLKLIEESKRIESMVDQVEEIKRETSNKRDDDDIRQQIIETSKANKSNTAHALYAKSIFGPNGSKSSNKPLPNQLEQRPRIGKESTDGIIRDEIEWGRYQEELLMKSLLMDPITTTNIDKPPPNIDHLLIAPPTDANTNPQDLILPPTDPKRLRILQQRNTTRTKELGLADVNPQMAQELKDLMREVRKLRKAQGIPTDDLITTPKSNEKDGDQLQVANLETESDLGGESRAKRQAGLPTDPTSQVSEQINNLTLEKIVLEQNVAPGVDTNNQYEQTMSKIDKIVVNNNDSTEPEPTPHSSPSPINTTTKPQFTPEDESNLKELMGSDYIPDIDQTKGKKAINTTNDQQNPREPQHFAHISDKIAKSRPVQQSVNEPQFLSDSQSDQFTPLTRHVVLPDNTTTQPISTQPVLSQLSPDSDPVRPKLTTTTTTTQPQPQQQKENPTPSAAPSQPELPLDPVARRRLQKEAKRQQKIAETQQQIQSLIEPGRETAQLQVEKQKAAEKQHREFQEEREHQHKQMMEKNQSRLKQMGNKSNGGDDGEGSVSAIKPKVGGENITAIDTNLPDGKTGKMTSHASALDAFFAENDDFDGLFGAEADAGDDKSPLQLEADHLNKIIEENKAKMEKAERDDNFIELETAPESILDQKAREARHEHEKREEANKAAMQTKSNLSIFAKLDKAKESGEFKTPFERQRERLQAAGELPLEDTIVSTEPLILDTQQHDLKSKSQSVFQKLEQSKKSLKEVQELQLKGQLPVTIDPSVPNFRKSRFSLSSLTLGDDADINQIHDGDEISQDEIEQIDDTTGLATRIVKKRVKVVSGGTKHTPGAANVMATAFKRGVVDKAQHGKLIHWLHGFRSSMGLPQDETLDRKDLSKTPLLPPHLLEEFENALIDTHGNNEERNRLETVAAQKKGYKINSSMPSVDEFTQSIQRLKRDDHDAFVFMFSVLYENGGNALLIMSRAFGQAQRDVLEGRVKTTRDFRAALEKYGLTRDMISTMGKDVERLFDDLEAERLGLDAGGELVDDEGTPVVQDPLGDIVSTSKRPIYGDGATDLNLVAVMKRKERSTIFKNLDEEVDDQMEQEVLSGTGIFQALTQKTIPLNLDKLTALPSTTSGLVKRDSDKYKSTLPQYLDPKAANVDKFDDFFTPQEVSRHQALLAPEGAQPTRTSVFQGLLRAIDTDEKDPKSPQKMAFELTPHFLGEVANPTPGRLTNEQLDHLGEGIRNRVEVLVDRISRHTLLTPALVLEKMENPREFGKLLSLLTPDMVQEMHLVDTLLDDNTSAMTKHSTLEFADIKHPKHMSDNQMFTMLPHLQVDLKNLWEQSNSLAPRDVVFTEDTKRDYLAGFIDPHLLGLETNADGTVSTLSWAKRLQKYLPPAEEFQKDPKKRIDWGEIAKKVCEDVRVAYDQADVRFETHETMKMLERYQATPTPELIDNLMAHEKTQSGLLESINKSMAEKDKLLTNSLFRSVLARVDGEGKKHYIVDRVKDRTSVMGERRKLQLIRIKDKEMKEMLKVHEITYNRLLANVEIMEEQLRLGLKPRPLVKSLEETPNEEEDLLAEMAQDLASSSFTSVPGTSAEGDIVPVTNKTGHVPSSLVSFYDLKFGRQQLEAFEKNPTTSPLAELIDFWAKPSTTQQDIDRLTGELAHTTFGRLYKTFGAFFPALPKKTAADISLSKFFENTPDARDKIEQFTDSMTKEFRESAAKGQYPTTRQTFGEGTELGRLVRSALEEAAIGQLPEATQQRLHESKVELEKVFNDYRQLEIMYDRQARIFVLERERKQLGLPDFQELNMLKTKFDLLLATLQTPGLHADKKQHLMDSAREIMTQTVAVRNLKETDPEMFYWRSFLAKIPPKFHKAALNCHNMPIDPMRLFDDLNPSGDLSPEEVLKNVLRFINENYRSTQRLLDHVEHRATAQNVGSPTMTLRDLRKEQMACRRLLKFKNQVNDQRIGAKETIRQHYSENYIHQLRVIRMKQLMDEPDVNEAKRAELEFWLDESHQKGKKAGLRNALIQDLEDGVDSPIAAINPNPVSLMAHKKLLKRQRAQIDPILFNSKTGRLFSNDRLNPLIKYQKVLQRRGERRKASLKRLAAEEALEPTELAAINAAREGNRLLSYLGTHGVGSTNLQKDIQDLLGRQAKLLEQQKELLDVAGKENADGDDIEDNQETNISENETLDVDNLGKTTNKSHNPDLKIKDHKVSGPQRKTKKSPNALPLAIREEEQKKIDSQLAVINQQIAGIVAKKEDFDAKLHVRHDAKDSSLVHIANQPFVYARVVASYGQTVVVEQCGSNSYMKHAQFFVQDELQQIQRAAGFEPVQLDNRDNLDHETDDEFDHEGNPKEGKLIIPQHQRKRNAIRGNRRRWHCIKSRHMDLLCGDYVFIDPAPGRAWTSGANESTANSTLTAMNNTGADDHGLVKATFSRLNMLQKSGRSTSKLGHLEEANPICANTDHMVILCAAEGQPAFSTSLIDRYLAAANFSGIKATIVYNKIDLIEMVSEAERILNELKDKRLTVHEKEKTLKKKMGKKDFKKMKRNVLKDQKKKLRDTHFYTTTMQRYMNKLLYSEALAKELQELDQEESFHTLVDEHEQNSNINTSDLYHEDEHGRLTLKSSLGSQKPLSSRAAAKLASQQRGMQGQPRPTSTDYSVPALVKRSTDPTVRDPTKITSAIDYYYNDEDYDDEEEDRVLLEQQLERWIHKKKRQVSREVEDKLREYERIGIKVIRVSARTGVGIDELEQLLGRFHSTGFVGQSGVGKSSLLNAIIPDLDLQTTNITVEGKGQHTTTSSRMFHLPNGGSVIDTPGSQSFVPPAVDPDFVQELFPEIKALSKFCKLGHKCVHTKEIGCAVREAVGDGSNRAIIPVTITELFDPLMMQNLRVQEFRTRLENGELRDIAEHYAGNDPVLLYARRFYKDLDSGKILTSNVHSHIPLDTAVDLGAKLEMDERGQAILQGQEDVRRTHRSTNPVDLEKSPENVIPMEESDFDSDGEELPYEVRKVKHSNREIVEMINLKLQHFGDDAHFTEEEIEYGENEHKLNELLNKHKMLKEYRAQGGIPGDANDPYVMQVKEEKRIRKEAREKKRQAAALRGDDNYDEEFDFNFDYNIDAMTDEILRLQKSDFIFEAEHMEEASGNLQGLKDDLYRDARKTAIALAEIDLQDRLKRHQERRQRRAQFRAQHQEIQEQNPDTRDPKQLAEEQMLKIRADKLGISVDKLLELQDLVLKQRKSQADTHDINSASTDDPTSDSISDSTSDSSHDEDRDDSDSPDAAENDSSSTHHQSSQKVRYANTEEVSAEYNSGPMFDEHAIDEPHEAVFERVGQEFEENARQQAIHNQPKELHRADKPLTKKEKYAQLQYQSQPIYTPHPSGLGRDPRAQSALSSPHSLSIRDAGLDSMENIEGADEATAELILQQNQLAKDAEKEFREANQPIWRRQRDKLTERRFGSRLPANANAYIPQFRYDNYIAMVELMKKTEKFLEKRRKKKSLTKQEEQKLEKQTRQAQLYEKRQIQRRRLLLETDPYNAGADLRALENQNIKDPLKALTPAQMDWFAAKLGHKEGTAFPGRLSLLEEDKNKPIRKGKSDKQQDQEYYNQLINKPAQDDPAAGDDDGDVRSFQHQMLTNMSAIYDDRRKDYQNIKQGGHSDHYRQTKMLKSTWNEIQQQTNRGDMLAKMTQADYLTRTRFGGVTNRYGDQFLQNKETQWSDESEDSYGKRVMRSSTVGIERQKMREDHGLETSDIDDITRHKGGTQFFGDDEWRE